MRVTDLARDPIVAKLIVVRGPSGAGKSTVARAVLAATNRPTALVARDQYMLMFNTWGVGPTPDQELLEIEILLCLDRGFDVVFEGNFKVSTHLALLDRLLAAHPEENYFFYLDVSLQETFRRHGTRPQIISAEEMAEHYPATTPLGWTGEVLVPETLPAEDVVRLILDTAGLAT